MLSLKKVVFRVVFASVGLSALCQGADARLLVLSFQLPPPEVLNPLTLQNIQDKGAAKIDRWGSTHPQKFAGKMLKSLVPSDILPASTSGIMGIYGGYFGYSDHQGNLTFPLRHNNPSVTVIFTPSFDLEALYQQTYSGIFISQKNMTDAGIINSMAPQGYLYSLHMGVTGTDASVATPALAPGAAAASSSTATGSTAVAKAADQWTVSILPVAYDTRLPVDAVIIPINPKNVFVPLLGSPTNGTPHLILPTIYLIGKKNNDEILLNNQKNLQYFEEIVIADSTTVVNKDTGLSVEQSAVTND